MGVNRNKRSIVLDLKRAAACDALWRLIDDADVFIHSIRPQKIAKLGFGQEAVCARNDRIVYAGLHGYRSDGPYAGAPAYDDVIQGQSGSADLMARLVGEPRYLPTIMADKTCAQVAVYSVIAALFQRGRTGRGQFVEIPMFETMAAFNLTEHLFGHSFAPPEGPMGYSRVLAPSRRPYKTRDGYICMLAYTDAQWARFWDEVGRPDLADDPRFDTLATRSDNIGELYRIAGESLADRPTGDWIAALQSIEIPGAPVATHVHLIGRAGGVGDAVRAALAAIEASGIGFFVVMPPPQPFPRLAYAVLRDAIRGHPDRFRLLGGGGSLNPMIQAAGPRQTVRAEERRRFEATAVQILKDGGVGFGEITTHHYSVRPRHPYERVAADHQLVLLLADIAGRHGVVIDLHHDIVTRAVEVLPPLLARQPANPRRLDANLAAFERLLAHNRAAKFVWAHAGSDLLGHWTPALSRALLRRHPNLFMSIRLTPPLPIFHNHVMDEAGRIDDDWLSVFRQFPSRFVIGGDQFFVGNVPEGTPAARFARHAARRRADTRRFLAALPKDLATRIGRENALRLYRRAGPVHP